MVDVLVVVARALDVLHEVRPAGLQRPTDPLQERERLRLVVHRVERGDEVGCPGSASVVERAQVALLERDVSETALGRLRPRELDRIVREVVAAERARREALGELEERPAAPAAEIEQRSAFVEALGHAGDEREDVRVEHREDRLRALLGHDLVEARVPLVRHAAAVPEALDDVVLDGGQRRDPLRLDGEVVRRRRARRARRHAPRGSE